MAADDLDARVRALAAEIAGNAPLSIAAAKSAVAATLSEAAGIAACVAGERQCIDSADHVEGRRAFMGKRKPVFHGR